MALSNVIDWEKRATNGNDNNGGGFNRNSGGTDRSQQNAAQVAIDNATITTSITTSVITFTGGTYTVLAGDVGNVVQMLTGTNVTAGFYEITSVSAGLNGTWTVDRNVVTSGTTTNATGKMGGALQTTQKIIGSGTPILAGHRVFDRYNGNTAGDTITASVQLQVSGDLTNGRIEWHGYDTTRGDNTGNRSLITCATNSVVKVDYNGKSNWLFDNLRFTDTAGTRGGGLRTGSAAMSRGMTIRNCVIDGMSVGVQMGNIGVEFNAHGSAVEDCEIKNCTSDGVQLTGLSNAVRRCYIHDNTGSGIRMDGMSADTGGLEITGNFIAKNGSKGISLTTATAWTNGRVVTIDRNTIYKSTSDGIASTVTTGTFLAIDVVNNIIYGNGGFGINLNNSTNLMVQANHTNAYGSNTSGDVSNWTKSSDDLTLTANPLTSDTDCTLNTTAGGGPVCKGAGFPGAFKGAATNGFIDVNAIQHQDTGGGGFLAPRATVVTNIGTY